MSKIFKDPVINKILYLIALVNLSLLIFYIFNTYQYYFTSDSASKVLFTAEAIKLGNLHPGDWNYVNNDIRVLAPHYFIAPFLLILPPTYLTHALGGVLAALTILTGVWLALRTTSASNRNKFLVLIVVLSGLSPINANNIFGEYVYGTDLAIACFIIFLCHSYLLGEKNCIIFGSAIALIFLLVFWSNPIRAIASFFLPFLFATLFTFASDKSKYSKNKVIQLILFGSIGCLAGTALHTHTLNSINMIMSSANLKWVSISNFFPNLLGLIENFFTILGGTPTPGTKMLSVKGITQGIYLINAMAFAGLVIFVTFTQLQKYTKEITFLGVYALTSFGCIAFITITTGLTGHRYINPSVILVLIYIFSCNNQIYSGKVSKSIKTLTLTLFIFSSLTAYTTKNDVVKSQIGITWNTEYKSLINFLEHKQLTYGFATYWNASSITVLSDEIIKIRAIEISSKIPKPYRWLSFDHWYYKNSDITNSFLLLSEDESKLIDWKLLNEMGLTPTHSYVFGNYYIFTFDKNLAAAMEKQWK